MARDFTDILNAVWAANALTTIPNPPIPGQAYRNTEIDDSNLENGQQYSEVYDSARYNQLLYLLSGCLKMLMETGIPEWSATQNYQQNAYTIGSDGKLYGPAKKASGPDNGGAVDPVTDAAGEATTWTLSLPEFEAPLRFDAAEGVVKLDTGKTTTTTANKLEVKVDASGGLDATGANGLKVKASNGIAVSSNGTAVKAKANGGVTVDGNGVSLNLAAQFGAYSEVVDGYVASATVIRDTTSINNITTPGRYFLYPSVANTPVSLSAPSMLVVFGVTTNDGASFAASTLQILYAENPNGATEVWTRAASATNTWGTWTRQDAGSLKPFVAPTQSSPGKQGLVPAPQAIEPTQQPLRVLGPNVAFNTLTAGSFDVSWERANSTNIVLGAEFMASGTSLAAITYAGDFYAEKWSDAPDSWAGAGLYSLRELRPHGVPNAQQRVQYAFFYALGSQKIYWRGGTGYRNAGQPMSWTGWTQVAGGGGGSSQPGTVFYFGGTSAPQGSLPCNGAAVSRTTYAKLFAAIGTIWGAGNGRTTFNVPNLASRVMRSTDFSAYPVGTLQVEGLPNIAGTFGTDSWGGGVYVSGAFYDTGQRGGGDDNNGKSQSPRLGFSAQNSNGLYGAAAGVQPYGALLLPCIVY